MNKRLLGKTAVLALCLSVLPLVGMQSEKEVKKVEEYKRSFVERHPVLVAASVFALLINNTAPSKEAADRASNPLLPQGAGALCVRVGGGEIRDCYTGMLIDRDTFEALERDRRKEDDIYDII